MNAIQSLVENNRESNVLPLTVVRHQLFLFFALLGLGLIVFGIVSVLNHEMPIYPGEISILYIAKMKKYLVFWIFLFLGPLCFWGAYKEINSPAKFIIKENSVEVYSFANLGLSVSDSKRTVYISPNRDFLSIETSIKGKVFVVLNVEGLNTKTNGKIVLRPFVSMDDAYKFALNLHLELNLNTPIRDNLIMRI